MTGRGRQQPLATSEQQAPFQVRGDWHRGTSHPDPNDPTISIFSIPERKDFQKPEHRQPGHFIEEPMEEPVEAEGTFRFLDLPPELRLRVYTFLVQTGCIFHITLCIPPHTSRCGGEWPVARWPASRFVNTSLTKIIPPWTVNRHTRISALLSSNRQIHAETSSLLYGENTFTFRESGHNCQRHSTFRTKLPRDAKVWTKMLPGRPVGLWPLTERTAKLVKAVKILVIPGNRHHQGDWTLLSSRLRSIVEKLKHCQNLRSLDVTLSEQYWGNGNVLHDLSVEQGGKGDHVARFMPNKSVPTCDQPRQFVLEPFAELHGIPDVRISGFVDAEFNEQLRNVVQSEKLVVMKQSPLVGVTETRKIRRRNGGVRKRAKQFPVLKYWEPKLLWDVVLKAQEGP